MRYSSSGREMAMRDRDFREFYIHLIESQQLDPETARRLLAGILDILSGDGSPGGNEQKE